MDKFLYWVALCVLPTVFCGKYVPKWKKQACELPSSHSEYSHYICSDDGEVKCLPGWNGDLCDVPKCRSGCDPMQGLPRLKTPLEIWKDFINDEIVDIIVENSNIYISTISGHYVERMMPGPLIEHKFKLYLGSYIMQTVSRQITSIKQTDRVWQFLDSECLLIAFDFYLAVLDSTIRKLERKVNPTIS
ncbi:hypothetical protein HUJ04_011668 [Dendroctonus ponderosae]|nr:hypothetical protein HUJ04_011668 [Dendroctonus ponderosae]